MLGALWGGRVGNRKDNERPTTGSARSISASPSRGADALAYSVIGGRIMDILVFSLVHLYRTYHYVLN